MLGLSRSFQHARRKWLIGITLMATKPKWVSPRSINGSVPYTPTTAPANFRLLSTSSSAMDALSSNACHGVGTMDDMIRRSKNSSEVQKGAVDLPEVPSIPARKRTFHLSHEELESHVRPLLACHWHIGCVGDRVADDCQVLSLNKLFSFKNFQSSVQFFDALVSIQDEEDHHARVTVDYSKVYVSIHTHCAYPVTSDSGVGTTTVKVPGLSVRDVRFAVRVENLHEKFLDDGRATTRVPVDSVGLQTWSMEQLQRRYPASRG